MLASKTKKRIEIINRIKDALTTPEVFDIINYQNQKENKILSAVYPYVVFETRKIFNEYYKCKEDKAIIKTNKSLLWEGNKKTTVNHIEFFGGKHRPDLIIDFEEGFKIAIEATRGINGHSFRKGIAQSLIYTSSFMADFSILLFIDITKEKKFLKSINGIYEQRFLQELWKENNISIAFI
jgi:hypothetical protein